jgi:hypothetical protein
MLWILNLNKLRCITAIDAPAAVSLVKVTHPSQVNDSLLQIFHIEITLRSVTLLAEAKTAAKGRMCQFPQITFTSL